MAKKKMYRRPDGLYEISRVIDGKRKVFRGHTQREVEQKLRAYQDEQDNGPLFECAAENWWGEILESAAATTVHGYRPAYRRAVEHFSGHHLFDLTAQDVKRWITDLARQDFAKKTIQNHLIVMSGIFKLAGERYNREHNPAALVRLPKGLAQSPRQLPTDEDDARMMSAATHPFGLFAMLAKYTGARRGELLGLRWEDIDFGARTIRIQRSVYHTDNAPHVKSPKTAAGTRTVPLLDIVANLLPDPSQHTLRGYLFSDDGGTTPLTNSRARDLWDAYCRDSGVTATPHQWRHLYATVLYEAGIEAKDAQSLLGHAQFSTTMDIYTHVKDQRVHKAAQRLNRYIKIENAQ